MREQRSAYKILVRNLKPTDHLKSLGLDGRIMLKIILKENVWEGVACVNLVHHV
jgi:hypothetical protein